MVLDNSLLNTQDYKVSIKGKVEQYKERSTPPPHVQIGFVAIKREPSGHPQLQSQTLLLSLEFSVILNESNVLQNYHVSEVQSQVESYQRL